MKKLSVVIISYNEEKNIGRCLDSVADVADEILVVDSFSTDKTEEICKAKGVRFLQHAFLGHIEQKNYAASQALYDQVLSLDADEALSSKLSREIANIKKNWEADGYYMNRLTWYCGTWIRHCGWYPDKKLRLWNRKKGKWEGTNPHDRYELQNGSEIGFLKGAILHYSFYSIHEHVNQVNYFTNIASEALFKKGKSVTLLHLIVSPIFKFFRDYFLKAGFLDGYYGFVVCVISSYASFLKYAKLKSRLKEGNQ